MGRPSNHDRGLYRVGKRWYLRIAVHGQMQRFGKPNGFATKDAARTFRDRLQASLRERQYFPGSQHTHGTVKELCDAYLKSIAGKKSSYRDIKRHLDFWAERFPKRAILTLTPSDISAGLSLLRTQCSGATANKYAKSFKAMMRRTVKPFTWVVEFWRDVELFPEEEQVMPIYTTENMDRLLAAATEHDALLIYLNRLLGLRQGLFFAMRWEWIRWQQGMLSLPSFKKQKAFTLPLSTDALAILQHFHITQGKPSSGWIFPAPISGTDRFNFAVHRDPHNWYNRTFKPLLRKLGMGHLNFHTLRHSWATALGEKVPQRIMQILGNWADIKMTARYSHPHEGSLRDGMEWVARSMGAATLLPEPKIEVSQKLSKLLKTKDVAV